MAWLTLFGVPYKTEAVVTVVIKNERKVEKSVYFAMFWATTREKEKKDGVVVNGGMDDF
jgi:hypothetical protein